MLRSIGAVALLVVGAVIVVNHPGWVPQILDDLRRLGEEFVRMLAESQGAK